MSGKEIREAFCWDLVLKVLRTISVRLMWMEPVPHTYLLPHLLVFYKKLLGSLISYSGMF